MTSVVRPTCCVYIETTNLKAKTELGLAISRERRIRIRQWLAMVCTDL